MGERPSETVASKASRSAFMSCKKVGERMLNGERSVGRQLPSGLLNLARRPAVLGQLRVAGEQRDALGERLG